MLRNIRNIIKSKASVVSIDQVVFSGNTFLSTALLARLLGPENFGIYSSIILGIYFLQSVANALVVQPFQVAFGRFEQAKKYLGFTLVFQIIICLAIAFLTIGLFSYSNKLFFLLKDVSIQTLLPIVVFWLMHDYFRKIFLASNRIRQILLIDILVLVCQLSGIGFLYFNSIASISAVLSVVSISLGLATFTGLVLSDIRFDHLNFNEEFWHYHKKEGSFLLLSAVFQWFGSNLFVVASGLFLGIQALGAFRLAQTLFGVLNILLQTYENYVLPNATKLYAKSANKAKSYLLKTGKMGLAVFAAVLLPLFFMSKPIMHVFGGPEYMPYHLVIKGMVLLYAVIFIGYSVRLPIRMLALNKSFFIGYCLSLIFSLLSINFLLENYGLTGAVFGLVTNQILMILYWQKVLIKNQFILWK